MDFTLSAESRMMVKVARNFSAQKIESIVAKVEK